MVFVSSFKKNPFVLLVLLFASSGLYHGIHGLGNQKLPTTKLVVINHECQSCPNPVSSLKDVHTYSELKYDHRASLPSSFTICVSVLVTADNLSPSLFSLAGKDGNPWFSASIHQPRGEFVGKRFFYPLANQWGNINTMQVFPNQWARSCLSLNTLSGLVQWVARGEVVDNRTFPEITNNVPTDLSGKLGLGRNYVTFTAKWFLSSNKLTKLEIFSSALTVEKMVEYTKGEGCGDDGDYLSWDEMVWNLHGE